MYCFKIFEYKNKSNERIPSRDIEYNIDAIFVKVHLAQGWKSFIFRVRILFFSFLAIYNLGASKRIRIEHFNFDKWHIGLWLPFFNNLNFRLGFGFPRMLYYDYWFSIRVMCMGIKRRLSLKKALKELTK